MRFSSFCVGELSSLDMGVIIRLARASRRILEFGIGGSTTLFAQFCAPGSEITAVESNPEWIKRTGEMCAKLRAPVAPRFVLSTDWKDWKKDPALGPWFDLVFIDALHMADRIPIAEQAWNMVAPEGLMAWHDTHGSLGEDVFRFLAPRHLEVAQVTRESALTIARKAVRTEIGNVDAFESRAPWESGHGELPAGWPLK